MPYSNPTKRTYSPGPRQPDVDAELIRQEATDAATQGIDLASACPYPFWSQAGQFFKSTYWAKRAELAALTELTPQPTTDGAQRSSTWPFLNHPGKPDTPPPPAQKQTRQKPDLSGLEDALI